MTGRLLVNYGEVITARDLGMRTITFTSARDLDRELRLATAADPG
jgi:hypothetical protein